MRKGGDILEDWPPKDKERGLPIGEIVWNRRMEERRKRKGKGKGMRRKRGPPIGQSVWNGEKDERSLLPFNEYFPLLLYVKKV